MDISAKPDPILVAALPSPGQLTVEQGPGQGNPAGLARGWGQRDRAPAMLMAPLSRIHGKQAAL